MKKKRLKILVAMSGGVDSSVSAKLLKNQGHDVTGVFLRFWKDESAGTAGNDALADAQKMAEIINIPFLTIDLSKSFREEVVGYFLDEYRRGRTPNPCVVCNRRVKLGRLLDYARQNGYDAVATGHYIKTRKRLGKYQILRSCDQKKDQTYFLYTLNQEDLGHLLFPVGGYRKKKVKKLAEKFGLPVYKKPESQDICFLSGPHNEFLKKYLDLHPGKIIEEETDREVGKHWGLPLYTIGQRRGIEIGGTGPYYVSGFDYNKNILYVAKNWNDKKLYKTSLLAKNVNWISGKWPKKKFSCGAVIRYGHPAERAKVKLDREKRGASVIFSSPQRAITSGQSVVFFKGKRVLGGGVIS